jgi:hypothetical protein
MIAACYIINTGNGGTSLSQKRGTYTAQHDTKIANAIKRSGTAKNATLSNISLFSDFFYYVFPILEEP